MWPASLSTDISSFYYSDINLFLIDYTWCKLYNIWLLRCENNSRSITIQQLNTGGKHCFSYYTRRVIDHNLERQTKNGTLYTCRLFLLIRIFKYISNCSKAFEVLPTLFFDILRVINSQIFLDKQFFTCSRLYITIIQVYIQIGLTFLYLSFLVHFQL